MSLYDQLGGNAPMTPRQMLAELKARPAAMLAQHGLSVPDGMADAQQILQHLVSTGQVGNERVKQLMRMIPHR